jgi:pilus assembly protein CpaF
MATVSPDDIRDGITRAVLADAGRPAPVGDVSLNAAPGVSGHRAFEPQLHQRLLAEAVSERARRWSERDLRRELSRLADDLSHDQTEAPSFQERDELIDRVVDEALGYGPIGVLIRDQSVSEILINGPRQVFAERQGQLYPADVAFRDEDHLLEVVRRMIANTGRRLDTRSPMVDARLPDGSRLNAVLAPPALNGPLVSIRKFGVRPLTADDLLAKEALTRPMLDFLAACVKARISVIISGGTGSGKTTLLNALSRFIPCSERLVTVEDTPELELQQVHVAKMASQPADLQGVGEVTMRDLVRNALRMRPDRIIVGECRGGEALEMLHALNTGHEGSLTTVHANSTREALVRVELMVSLAGIDISVTAVRKLIASSVNLIVQVARLPGGRRKVVTVSEIVGMEETTISMHDIFEFVQTGVDERTGAEGHFRPTGIRPLCLKKLTVRGAVLPPDLFVEQRVQAPGRGWGTGR